jgi:hypothetical protein
MAVLTLAQLQDLFFGVTVTMTGLDPKMVRHAYPSDGQPAWENTQNVVLLNVTEADDEYNRKRDLTYTHQDSTHATESVFYTRVMQVQWTTFGPLGYDMADTIRYAILTEAIRNTLRASEVYPIPDIAAPSRLPYDHNTQWWERSDLYAKFNVATRRTNTVPYIDSATVEIIDDAGAQNIIQT